MLEKFYLENYRNLELPYPLCFDNVTGIYGICGSGKSNFCRALGDIARAQTVYNVSGDKEILFFYVFRYGEEDVEILYKRNKEGIIYSASFFAVQSRIEGKSDLESRDVRMQLMHIRKNMLESGKRQAIYLIDQLIKEIGDICIVTSEEHDGWRGTGLVEDISSNCGNQRCVMDDAEKASLIIYDDIDVEMNAVENFMKRIQFFHTPVVYTTRRPALIEKWCEKVENCILICEGKAVNAKIASKKDLRTLKQLVCFLKAQPMP